MLRNTGYKAAVGSTALLVSLLLAGCATLPSSGPTRTDVTHDRAGQELLGFQIVDIDTPAVVQQAGFVGGVGTELAQLQATGSIDMVGPGDVLSITIFEVGSSLFQGGQTALGNDTAPGSTSVGNSSITGVTVDREGAITLPYIGRLIVKGLTPVQIQQRIERKLKGMSQSPQALVSVRSNVANTVVVLGVVARPGRQQLTLAESHLLDAIAEAGGTGEQAQEDMVVRFTRHGRSVEQLLSLIKSGGPDDLQLLPGDRIQVIRRPQSFTVFGATKVSQINFENPTLTLAEALARAGGPDDNRADPSAIFIFRYARNADGSLVIGNKPDPSAPSVLPLVIYRLDMMRPASYFLAQAFSMRDKDVIYIANARANRPAKMVGIINQLISPAVTAKVLTQ